MMFMTVKKVSQSVPNHTILSAMIKGYRYNETNVGSTIGYTIFGR